MGWRSARSASTCTAAATRGRRRSPARRAPRPRRAPPRRPAAPRRPAPARARRPSTAAAAPMPRAAAAQSCSSSVRRARAHACTCHGWSYLLGTLLLDHALQDSARCCGTCGVCCSGPAVLPDRGAASARAARGRRVRSAYGNMPAGASLGCAASIAAGRAPPRLTPRAGARSGGRRQRGAVRAHQLPRAGRGHVLRRVRRHCRVRRGRILPARARHAYAPRERHGGDERRAPARPARTPCEAVGSMCADRAAGGLESCGCNGAGGLECCECMVQSVCLVLAGQKPQRSGATGVGVGGTPLRRAECCPCGGCPLRRVVPGLLVRRWPTRCRTAC